MTAPTAASGGVSGRDAMLRPNSPRYDGPDPESVHDEAELSDGDVGSDTVNGVLLADGFRGVGRGDGGKGRGQTRDIARLQDSIMAGTPITRGTTRFHVAVPHIYGLARLADH